MGRLGHWRVSNASAVIETCASASSCVGGADSSAFCADGHTGVLCAVCADGYRPGSQGGCVACSGGDAIEFADVLPMVIVLGVVIPLVLACCRTVMRRRRAKASDPNAPSPQKRAYREKPKETSQRVLSSAITKLKIMTAHQQVLQGLSGVFRITWPAAFKEVLAYMSVFNFDFVSIVPLECVFPYDLCVEAARTTRGRLPPPLPRALPKPGSSADVDRLLAQPLRARRAHPRTAHPDRPLGPDGATGDTARQRGPRLSAHERWRWGACARDATLAHAFGKHACTSTPLAHEACESLRSAAAHAPPQVASSSSLWSIRASRSTASASSKCRPLTTSATAPRTPMWAAPI